MARIINIRGTSGSGKSYLAQRVMACYDRRTPHFYANRKQPIGYTFERSDGPPLFAVGHYENPDGCGGCDNIAYGYDFTYDLIQTHAGEGKDIIYEGLVIASDVRHCIGLQNSYRHKLLVIGLDTPLEQCLTSVMERRARRGKTDPLNPKNTTAKFKALIPQRARFKDAGIDFRLLNRESAFLACLEFLELRPVTPQDTSTDANGANSAAAIV